MQQIMNFFKKNIFTFFLFILYSSQCVILSCEENKKMKGFGKKFAASY